MEDTNSRWEEEVWLRKRKKIPPHIRELNGGLGRSAGLGKSAAGINAGKGKEESDESDRNASSLVQIKIPYNSFTLSSIDNQYFQKLGKKGRGYFSIC